MLGWQRKQRVVIPGGVSDWTYLRGRVPFLLYINDIVHGIGLNIPLFADDTYCRRSRDSCRLHYNKSW